MKKITITFFAILTFVIGFGSCADFLEVRPKSSSPDYLMFSTADGFVHALNGAYLVMRQNIYHPYNHYYGGYNKDANGFFEYMGGGWVQSGNVLGSKEANLYNHDYYHYLLASDITSYYKGQYKTVTNLNLILKWIDDENQTFLSDELYSVVKGEALALKAFMLFELIQTYGPPPTSTGLHNNVYIPYPYTVNTAPYVRETYTKFMQLLWEDIVEAEKLLEKYDPLISYSVNDLYNTGDWRTRRNNKMNYYALMGLKARVQLYIGDKPGALQSALVVINAKNEDGSEKFPFMAIDDYHNQKDLIGVCEHMFAFEHDYTAGSWTITTANVPQYFIVSTEASGATWQHPKVYNIAPHGRHLLDRFPGAELYGNYGLRTQDIRLEKWFSRTTTGVNMLCQKYYPLSQSGHNSALPILRKGEMLLIAAECEPTLSKAAEYLSTLRQGRWIPKIEVGVVYKKDATGLEILENGQKVIDHYIVLEDDYHVEFATEEDRMYWVIGEYSREFIMEGRAFFAWKRLGLNKIPYPVSYYETENALAGDVLMDDAKYILPIPDGEIYIVD